MSVRDEVLVGPAALRGLLDSARPVVLLDVRWALGRTDGHEQYVAGHVPGAVYVDLDTELASPPSAAEGRHPLPALDDLEASARRWGVSEDVTVVVYDDAGGMSAARACGSCVGLASRTCASSTGGSQRGRRRAAPSRRGTASPTPARSSCAAGRCP